MKTRVRTVNVKTGLPTVEQAVRRLQTDMAMARPVGVVVLKVIHGYGSSGRGEGRLGQGLRQWLAGMERAGKIRGYFAGEDWDIYDDASRALRDEVPELARDPDLGRGNRGITLVWL